MKNIAFAWRAACARRRSLNVLAAFLALAPACVQAFELPKIFADGMVLQRDRPIMIWGTADAGAEIEARLDGRHARARADADGRWMLELAPHPAGGPYELAISEGGTHQRIRDVLVGDVWLASGQSNMEWPLSQAANPEVEIARATNPRIRHFKVPKSWAGEPQAQLEGGHWVAASPQAAGEFSAVAHLFAREIHARTGVPIGIIDSTWGGSRIEAWMDASSQNVDMRALAQRMEQMRADDERALAGTHARLETFGALPADDAAWSSADLDESRWQAINVPGNWEQGGFTGLDGVAWYRTTFDLTARQATREVTLSFARVDDSDTAWVNGVKVGATYRAYDARRVYSVPASALRAGRNVIAVRVEDDGGGGGIHGAMDEMYVQPAEGTRIALPATWKFRVASASVQALDDKNQIPTVLYNRMIHPLQPYALRGVIWYQGEANANTVDEALAYRRQFPALIQQWRTQWRAPGLPFLWVQLANFGSGADQGDQSPWAVLRESQSAALSLPHTAQAVTIDIGNATDIHPLNKQDVAHRLALGARTVAYGETLIDRGPVQRTVSFEGGAARIGFDLDGSTLAVRGGGSDVHGFALAGADRRFHPARAHVEGDAVVVRSDAVARPVAVRYGWRDNPEDADLISRDGLPASPFRSDDW